MTQQATVPAALRGFLCITEIDDAGLLAGPLFRRKFAQEPPEVGHHLVGLYRGADGRASVLGYSHMRAFGDIYLSGGSCSDGEAIRAMPPEHRQALSDAGGIWFLVLRYAFHHFADRCDAFFGYSGDRRALEVAHAAGFEDAGHTHLIVHWHKPLHPVFRRALVAKAHALGPF